MDKAMAVAAHVVVLGAAWVVLVRWLFTASPDPDWPFTRLMGSIFAALAELLDAAKRRLIDIAWRVLRRHRTRKGKHRG